MMVAVEWDLCGGGGGVLMVVVVVATVVAVKEWVVHKHEQIQTELSRY